MYEYDEDTIMPVQFPSHLLPIAVIGLARTSNKIRYPDRKIFSNNFAFKESGSYRKRLPNYAWSSRTNKRPFRSRDVSPLRKRGSAIKSEKRTKQKDDLDRSGNDGSPDRKRQRTRSRSSRSESRHRHRSISTSSAHSSHKTARTHNSDEKRKQTHASDTEDVKSVRKNLFDLFDEEHSKETDTSEKPQKKQVSVASDTMDTEKRKKRETIVVAVVNQSENDDGEANDAPQANYSFDDSDAAEDADDHPGQLLNEIDPECSKLLARLKEVENEIQQEQDKLSKLENIPKVLDTILEKKIIEQPRGSGASTPTMDEPIPSGASTERITPMLNFRIKTEPISPPPPILSPNEPFGENVFKNTQYKSRASSSETAPDIVHHKENQNTSNTEKYSLKALSVGEHGVRSIYNKANGIALPISIRSPAETKDPRLQRMLSGGTKETPFSNQEFNRILRKIKQEPAEDERYGKLNTNSTSTAPSTKSVSRSSIESLSTEKASNNVTPNAAMATSSHNAKDEVEKTLQELDKVIKVIQDQCSTASDPDATQKSKGNKNGKNAAGIGDFQPRNMGFSSYLPEYSDENDYKRTARVLSQVFSHGKSPAKKEPMSSEDYFGKTLQPPTKNLQPPVKSNQSTAKNPQSTSTQKTSPQTEKTSDASTRCNDETESKLTHALESEKKKRKRTVSGDSNHSRSTSSSSKRRRSRTRSSSPEKPSIKKRLMSVVKMEKPDNYEKLRDDRHTSVVRKNYRVYSKGYFDAINRHNPNPYTTLHFENNVLKKQTVSKQKSSTPERSNSPKNYKSLSPGPYRAVLGSKGGKTSRDKTSDKSRGNNSPSDLRSRKKGKGKSSTSSAPRYKGLSGVREQRKSLQKEETRRIGLLGDKPGDCALIGKQNDTQEKYLQGNNEEEIDSTLSKAMTSLLQKILYNDKNKPDTSAEGRMADMVIQLMKHQLEKDGKQTSDTTPNLNNVSVQQCMDASQAMTYWPYNAWQYMQGNMMGGNVMWGYNQGQLMQNQQMGDHPFVPFIKQEKNIEEFGGKPFAASNGCSSQFSMNGPITSNTQSFNPSNHLNLSGGNTGSDRGGRNQINFSHFRSKYSLGNKSTFDNNKPFSSTFSNTRGSVFSRGFNGRGSFTTRGSSSSFSKYRSGTFNKSMSGRNTGFSGRGTSTYNRRNGNFQSKKSRD